MKIRNGTYRYVSDDPMCRGGVVDVDVKETENSFVFRLIRNTIRYSPAYLDMLFGETGRAVVPKRHSRHTMRFGDNSDDWFIIYPFQGGTPFLFEMVEM